MVRLGQFCSLLLGVPSQGECTKAASFPCLTCSFIRRSAVRASWTAALDRPSRPGRRLAVRTAWMVALDLPCGPCRRSAVRITCFVVLGSRGRKVRRLDDSLIPCRLLPAGLGRAGEVGPLLRLRASAPAAALAFSLLPLCPAWGWQRSVKLRLGPVWGSLAPLDLDAAAAAAPAPGADASAAAAG